MADKVRRVDWSPDEWLSGVTSVLTMDEVAVYIMVLNVIYSRGGTCPFDAEFIARLFRPRSRHRQSAAGQVRRTFDALNRLVVLGKLKVQTTHGGRWLVNGRADRELGRAQGRIESAAKAGIASGEARRLKSATTPSQRRRNSATSTSKSSRDNDLDRTVVRNHQPSPLTSDRESSTDAARARGSAVDGPAARAPAVPRKMSDVVANIARKRRGMT